MTDKRDARRLYKVAVLSLVPLPGVLPVRANIGASGRRIQDAVD